MSACRFATALLAASLMTSLSVALAPPQRAAAPEATTVRFDMLPSNHMVVQAKINGKGPFRMIFDLGAPVCLLGNKAAEASGVVKADAPRMFLFAMRGEARAETIELGDLKAKDVPVIVLDHPVVKVLGNVFEKPLDGIIGYTFFARYKTTIDYQARKMTFVPVHFKIRDLMKDLPERLSGPKIARHRILAPKGLWGLTVGERRADAPAPGVPILAVLPDSPAARAGLRPGDLLTTLDGRWTTSLADTYAAAAATPAGQAVEVIVLRDGHERTFTVTPAEGI
jgi:hypothetical protein